MKMGNDHSHMKGLEIDQKAVEVTDYWSLYSGELPNDNGIKLLSIFHGEPFVTDQLWLNYGPLERATKNLMVYRHPCILKYIASWDRGSTKMLATERCRPLALVVRTQNDIQVSLGLRNILCALVFLVEQASVRHLNICASSIYVTTDGAWKLAGFEYLWKNKEVTQNVLEKSKASRYTKAIDSNELQFCGSDLEQFSFAVLCEEVLGETLEIRAVEFKNYCKTHLKHENPSMRPKLSAVLLHPYFNHEFINIHSFLTELPLKCAPEKKEFFTGLIDRLRGFDETVVASQLNELLLSRIVLLDSTAQMCVTPYLLKPRIDNILPGIFSTQTFTKYIIPKIKQIFCVRDTQIRLILLEYFQQYLSLFRREDLEEHILPQLLLGIKDTNDVIVSKTLHCLAELVPILGANTVIGGNRSRLFADGRPQGLPNSMQHWVEPRSITPMLSGEYEGNGVAPDNVDISESYNSAYETRVPGIMMPERLSPDGGEDIGTASEVDLDDAGWSDWENEQDNGGVQLNENLDNVQIEETIDIKNKHSTELLESTSSKPSLSSSTNVCEDLNELDIKNQTYKKSISQKDEIDFFKDMEPIISKTNITIIQEIGLPKTEKNDLLPSDRKNDNLIEKSISDVGFLVIDNSNVISNQIFKSKLSEENETINIDKSQFDFKINEETDDTSNNPSGWDEDSDWAL